MLDVIKVLYTKGKDFASQLFQRSFFNVAQTPKFMQELGLRGNKFTIKYRVIARHFGKDGSYWNVNSGGVFRKGYTTKKENVEMNTELSTSDTASSDTSFVQTNSVNSSKSADTHSDNQRFIFCKITKILKSIKKATN